MSESNKEFVESELSTAETATGYVRRMVAMESRGCGDTHGALHRLCRDLNLEYWPTEHVRRGKAKRIEVGLYQRIRGAYIAYCEKQVAKLQHEIAVERALAADDDQRDLEVLESEVCRLAEALAARKKGA